MMNERTFSNVKLTWCIRMLSKPRPESRRCSIMSGNDAAPVTSRFAFAILFEKNIALWWVLHDGRTLPAVRKPTEPLCRGDEIEPGNMHANDSSIWMSW